MYPCSKKDALVHCATPSRWCSFVFQGVLPETVGTAAWLRLWELPPTAHLETNLRTARRVQHDGGLEFLPCDRL